VSSAAGTSGNDAGTGSGVDTIAISSSIGTCNASRTGDSVVTIDGAGNNAVVISSPTCGITDAG
jgi:hypothetical protein